MKKLILLFLPFSVAAAPISTPDLVNAAVKVANQIYIQCDCTITQNDTGTRHMSIGAIRLRWTVDNKSLCSKGSAFEFLEPTIGGTTVLMAATAPNGKLWEWSVGSAPPTDIDPWCLQ